MYKYTVLDINPTYRPRPIITKFSSQRLNYIFNENFIFGPGL